MIWDRKLIVFILLVCDAVAIPSKLALQPLVSVQNQQSNESSEETKSRPRRNQRGYNSYRERQDERTQSQSGQYEQFGEQPETHDVTHGGYNNDGRQKNRFMFNDVKENDEHLNANQNNYLRNEVGNGNRNPDPRQHGNADENRKSFGNFPQQDPGNLPPYRSGNLPKDETRKFPLMQSGGAFVKLLDDSPQQGRGKLPRKYDTRNGNFRSLSTGGSPFRNAFKSVGGSNSDGGRYSQFYNKKVLRTRYQNPFRRLMKYEMNEQADKPLPYEVVRDTRQLGEITLTLCRCERGGVKVKWSHCREMNVKDCDEVIGGGMR